MTQVALADKIGEKKQTLYKYETNIVTNIPIEKIELIASALCTTPAYIMGWNENTPALTEKDERDIARDVERIMGNLENSGELMFDGVPMSTEAKAAMAAAMQIGLEEAKRRNKETYTPKKYRKG